MARSVTYSDRTDDGGDDATRLRVCPTSERNFNKEYIAQLNEDVLAERFPETAENDFILIRNNDPIETEVHARVVVNDDVPDDAIGLDFTLRTALGAPSDLELEHGGASSVNRIEVESVDNAENRWRRRKLNEILGVRPQVCRVRMGVFPDLEDKTCRLSRNTMEMIGIEEGDNVTIESSRGERIVRGVKAYEIDSERKETKERQKVRDANRYPSCAELLQLDRIRRTEVDIPEIWIDEEVRVRLGLQELDKCGVCQPVRVYRDTRYLFLQTLHQFAVPLVIVLFAGGLEVQDRTLTLALWALAVVIWIATLLVESHSKLS